MNKIIYILFCFTSFIASAQSFNPKTIVLSDDINKSELSFLKEELKNAQIVLLGEDSHFHGNVFELKTKVINYLFHEMGYKTIAFESGIYDVWKAHFDINNGKVVQEALTESLYSIWAKRNEFQSFIHFYSQNKADLKLFGFDNQISGKYGEENLVSDLYAYCKKNNIKFKLKQDDFSLLIESMNVSGIFDEEDISYALYQSSLKELLKIISSKTESEEHFYWFQIIKGLLALGEERISSLDNLNSFYVDSKDNIRDQQMADNLLVYLKKHPNEKIIIWAANSHLINDMSSVKNPILQKFVPMGTYLKKELKNKVYSLATITASDSIFIQNKREKTPIEKNSFEDFLKHKNDHNLFISSNQLEMKKVISNRFFSPITFVESRLDLLHDGYIYLNKVKQSTILLPSDDVLKAFLDEKESGKMTNFSNENSTQTQKDTSTIALAEVIVYNKRTPYQIIRKVIDNLEKNYPTTPVFSKMYSNITTDIDNKTCLDIDFVLEQYEKSYFNYERSVKNLKHVRWNTKTTYEPQNIREFYGLTNNNPVKNAAFLNKRKFVKFDFILEEVKEYNKSEVYIIRFSTSRNHSTFTKRTYLSNYSGHIYIEKEDYAIVKIIENWEITDFPEQHREGLNLNGEMSEYNSKDYTKETIITDFRKSKGMYFISNSSIAIIGKINNLQGSSLDFSTTIKSFWNDFETVNPSKINFKEEQHLFHSAKYNEQFWNNYVFPNRNND